LRGAQVGLGVAPVAGSILSVMNSQVVFRCSHVRVDAPMAQTANTVSQNLRSHFGCLQAVRKTIHRMAANRTTPTSPSSTRTDRYVLWATLSSVFTERYWSVPTPNNGCSENAAKPCFHCSVRPFRSPWVISVPVVPSRWNDFSGLTMGITTSIAAARMKMTASRADGLARVRSARPNRRPTAAAMDAVRVPDSAIPMNAAGR